MAVNSEWQQIFLPVTEPVKAIGAKLHDVVLQAHPQSTVIAYPGYNSVNYGFGTKKNTEGYLYIMPQKERCNLGFYHGAVLPDPEGLLEGTGKALRHVKVRDIATAGCEPVADLITASVEERRMALGKN